MFDEFYTQSFELAGKRIRGRFVIPSGIRCTRASTIQQCFAEVPALGVITTKSLSVAPRPGYREPIYARYSTGSYINAVGLANPGAAAFRAELESITVPADKFLLVSIFGGDVAQFVEAARLLAPVADGFELNMSCPHAAGYGIEIGQDKDLVAAITREVIRCAQRPVFVKLSATIATLGPTAKAALEAGVTGFTVTNTIGPASVMVGTQPILSNKVGGLSGNAIRPLGLQAVRRVRDAVGSRPVIIGMGGIGTPEHVQQFRAAGADLFGVGSALTGLDSPAMQTFLAHLERDTAAGPSVSLTSDGPDAAVSMQYHRCRVVSRLDHSSDLFELRLDQLPGNPQPGDLAGRYFFLCLPGIGEKPFAVLSARDRNVVIKAVGTFTRHLRGVSVGTEILLRGPYGRPLGPVPGCIEHILVGGGTGIASLLEVGHKLAAATPVTFVLGGRSRADLFALDEFAKLGRVALATNDGSVGHTGFVTAAMQAVLNEQPARAYGFINCGPQPMIQACAEVQLKFAPRERIVGAVEYMTSCGVGICGKCAAPSGQLSCIDGPFLPLASFKG